MMDLSSTNPRSNESNHLTWDVIVLWGFVISALAAFVLVLHVIWNKCNSN